MAAINLAQYGFKVILPSEQCIVDYRELKEENLEVKVISSIGVLIIKFKSLSQADEFIGKFSLKLNNINLVAVKGEFFETCDSDINEYNNKVISAFYSDNIEKIHKILSKTGDSK